MSAPYSFQPVFAIDEAIELGRDLVGGDVGYKQVKAAAGIVGCACEKLDNEPTPFGASAEDAGVADATDEALVARLELETRSLGAAGYDAAALPPIVATLIFEIAMRVLRRFLDR